MISKQSSANAHENEAALIESEREAHAHFRIRLIRSILSGTASLLKAPV